MITRNQTKLIRRLKSRKRREEELAFLVEGVRLVEELLTSGWQIEFAVTAPVLSETARGCRLLEAIEAGGCSRAEVSDAELKQLADTDTPQGVLAVARRPRRRLAEFEPAARAALLVFDRLADPGNLGTLLRSAQALGVAWAVALHGTVDPWNPKAVRASAGSLFRIPVSQEPWPEVVAWLRGHDFTILCADPGGEAVGRTTGPLARFALVLGNEPSGLSGEVRRDCDALVAVRLPGGMDSLNVAIAGALLLDRLLAGSAS
ncbi:MAG: RNA methyltransferase [Gemmatimonadota bacterium]|nr:MAG: RNA methyltransferase [Gemmatimonadota bacterium]